MSTPQRQATRRGVWSWLAPGTRGSWRGRREPAPPTEVGHPVLPRRLVPLPGEECWRLLRTDSVGRIVYTYQALPAVVPVNYAVHGESVLVRTAPTTRLGQLSDGTVVAFEVDCIDRATRTGWSVVLVGATQALERTPPGMESALERAGAPWVTGVEGVTLRISPGFLTGRDLQPEV